MPYPFSASDAGSFIALDRGYFRDEGLDMDTSVQVNNFTEQVGALSIGQLDVGTGAISAGFFNAIARSVPLRIVADKGSTPAPAWDYAALVIRKDLIDSGRVTDFNDLKGLTIVNNGAGAADEYTLVKALEKGNLTLADIEFKHLAPPEAVVAFGANAIDGAMMIEPFISQAVSNGVAVRWKGTFDILGNQELAVIVFGPSLVTGNPDAAQRWMKAYLRGVRDYGGPHCQDSPEPGIS